MIKVKGCILTSFPLLLWMLTSWDVGCQTPEAAIGNECQRGVSNAARTKPKACDIGGLVENTYILCIYIYIYIYIYIKFIYFRLAWCSA